MILALVLALAAQPTEYFEAHGGIWLSLHHALYGQAQRERAAQGAKLWLPPAFTIHPTLEELPARDRAAWSEAVTYYAKNWADRDLLRDEDLSRIKALLAAHEGDKKLSVAGLPAELQAVLNRAKVIYSRSGWPAQRARYRDWFEGSQKGEILFHEASHGMVEKLQAALAEASHQHEPRDLWHATLFFTVGEAMQRHIPGYVSYAETQGLWKRAWPAWLQPLQQAWRPHLEGKVSLEKAAEDLVKAIPPDSPTR